MILINAVKFVAFTHVDAVKFVMIVHADAVIFAIAALAYVLFIPLFVVEPLPLSTLLHQLQTHLKNIIFRIQDQGDLWEVQIIKHISLLQDIEIQTQV